MNPPPPPPVVVVRYFSVSTGPEYVPGGICTCVTNCPLLYCNVSFLSIISALSDFPVPFIQKLYLQLLVGLNIKINEDIYRYIHLRGVWALLDSLSVLFFFCCFSFDGILAVLDHIHTAFKNVFSPLLHSWMSVAASSSPFF